MSQNQAKTIQDRFRTLFRDRDLLELALHHRSVAGVNNERLEYLGDAVLGLVIREHLYRRYPEAAEGVLSNLYHSLVSNSTLSEVATALGLTVYASQPTKKMPPKLRANTLEAVVGALYLDRGLSFCRRHVLRWFAHHLNVLPQKPGPDTRKHPKTLLKEYLDSRNLPNPSYALDPKTGNKLIHVSCSVEGIDLTTRASGSSRALAEKNAAMEFLAELNARDGRRHRG